MLKASIRSTNLVNILNGSVYLSISRKISDLPESLKVPSVIMCKDTKHILCYHPEPEHPIEFTRAIERKIETDSPLKSDLMNVYLRRFDERIPRNPGEHWVDALRLAKTFNEHPIIFRKTNRQERVKQYKEKVNPVKKNRESI